MQQGHTSRRNLLEFGLAAAAAIACDGCGLYGSRKPDAIIEPEDDVIYLSADQSSTLLDSEASLLLQPSSRIDKIVVVNRGEGKLYAVNAICTHKGCDVVYDKDSGHLRCPCHGSEFGLDGRNIKGPADQPLKSYNITIQSGRVAIEL
jgi:cytochrome b6-f complex iron-sulfur subunit